MSGIKKLFLTSCKTYLEEWEKKLMCSLNNAGLALGRDFFEEADLEDWETMIDTNVKGLLYVTKAILPFMISRRKRTYHQHWFCCRKGSLWKRKYLLCFKTGSWCHFQGTAYWFAATRGEGYCDPSWAAETNSHWFRFKENEDLAKKMYEGYTPLKRWRRSRYYLLLCVCSHSCLHQWPGCLHAQHRLIHFIYTKNPRTCNQEIYCERARYLRPNCKYRFHWLIFISIVRQSVKNP